MRFQHVPGLLAAIVVAFSTSAAATIDDPAIIAASSAPSIIDGTAAISTAAAMAADATASILAPAPRTTICTITVNSPDEKEVLQRYLPESRYQFVELVERGRPDWLGSACRKGVQCDVLVISGHFDSGTEFYTDRLHQRESLPVEEMERVACSDGCPGLFSKLKEVYLFGCNTLDGATGESTAAEIGRTLQRAGHPRADAERLVQALDTRYRESNRDTMRRIFSNVPVIYGFSALAPLGRYAGPLLERVLLTAPPDEIGSGLPSTTLLKAFGPSSMIAVSGLGDSEPRASARPQFCQFVDDRLTTGDRIDAVHSLIRRDPAEARMLLDRVEKVTQSVTPDMRHQPDVVDALQRTAADRHSRDRWLAYARKTDRPDVRTRLIKVGAALGWLSAAQERAELVRAIADQVELDAVSIADVDLACALNRDGTLDEARPAGRLPAARLRRASNAGVLACLGSGEARSRVLKALTSTDTDDVHVAQVYLKHRPLQANDEVRDITRSIARMPSADAQVRALETLGRHHVSDRDSIDELTRLFPVARSLAVQRAIAGVLIRADLHVLPRADVARVLRQHRLKSPDGADLIDVLIRRLSA